MAWVVLVEDVRPNPSCDQRTATSPIPIRIRLRTAWTATCGSFAQAWIAMSPPVRAGSRASPVNGGSSTQGSRSPCAPDRTGRRTDSGRTRWSRSAARPAARTPPRCPPAAPARRRRRSHRARSPRRGSSARPPRSSGRAAPAARPGPCVRTSSDTKCIRSCAGVMMPAWWAPWKATTSEVAGELAACACGSAAVARPAYAPPTSPASAAPAEAPSSRRRLTPSVSAPTVLRPSRRPPPCATPARSPRRARR